MTIASEANRSGPYACNGATISFSFGFKVYDERHVRVILTDAAGVDRTLSLGTDYTVAGVGGDAGGSVVTTAVHATGYKITILLSVPFTQNIDLENQGAYFAETIERAFDEAVQRVLQLREELSRAYKAPPSVSTGLTIEPSAFEEVLGNAAAVVAYKEAAAGFAADAAGSALVAEAKVAEANTNAGNAAASAAAAEVSAQEAAKFGGASFIPFAFVATSGQTVFNLGQTIVPTLALFFQNGVLIKSGGDDYTLTATTLTLTTAAAAGDLIFGAAFTSFAVGNALTPANNLSDLLDKVAARTNLGLGSAAVESVGAGANQLLKLDAAGKIPALDGSQLTGLLHRMTAIAVTSGTSKDFLNVPANAKRLTLLLNGISLSGSANLKIQLGTSAGIVSSGYAGTVVALVTGAFATAALSASGVDLNNNGSGTANSVSGSITMYNISSNLWLITAQIGDGTRVVMVTAFVTLLDILDRVRITTSTGTDTFTGGTANLFWE